MKKKLISAILLLLILITSIPSEIYAVEDLKINAKSAVLMDINTGAVLYKLNEDEKLAPASITKIMTMVLGMEALSKGKITLDDKVMVSEYAAGMGGSQVFLEAGETQTVENLFKAIVIRSANDASVALAEHISGSEDIFVKMMNQKANELGMRNTQFYNCSGLPHNEHHTSAYDVALMSKELLKYEKVHEWLTIYMEDLTVGKNKNSIQTMVNTNRLIKEYDGTTGVKTGSTNEAGFCVSGSAKKGNLELVAVVMGATDSKTRFNEAKRMLDYGFANYDSAEIGKKGDILATIPVEKGKLEEVDIMLSKDSYVLLPKGKKGNIEKETVLPDILHAPILAGDEIGELIIKIDGKEMDRIKLVSKSDVEKANLVNILNKFINNYLKGR
ncbi:D-alanyl-D-alanine carboxypeptidase family protein [Tissierella pigra]|uniref:serine-type D-Ala-D-Ala carboxypeptidase n=1 Tax=Tissierella pigra TaxID=2607614 RepID=A0A6N7XD14_9FIRM|nr:D-alanyl-D-alanine carboxypeptidase family protein [Tissierella pigra]MST99918.1 D-alanyl-D-alanine carboxypeptidase [Tissierella pigra]